MEPKTKKQKTEDLRVVSLVWLDDKADKTEENITAQQHLRAIDNNIKVYKGKNECEQFLKFQIRQKPIALIVSGTLGQDLVPRIHHFPQIVSIYVFCLNKVFHQQWAKEYPKVFCIILNISQI
jgi:hypothetical protein